ncbi:MAG TPA: T9SS type A sorting domain-containing protein [Flavipsychrobacter sp.]|nr:T9SS type A sorting domain-containing protein [Flavipsychrobacter sp.]
MKTIIIMAVASSLTTAAIAQYEITCPFTSITSDISTNTTLSAGTVYRIEGCIHVTSGATLTIPAGTVVLFEKSSNAGLNIDKGSYLLVQGSASAPVIFTSDQIPGQRNSGDYSGLVINGYATNNFSGNVMTTTSRNCNVDAGGTDDNDSSGSIKYLCMEFSKYGFTAASVGRKTAIENVMISYPERNAFEFLGGTVQARRLVAMNARESDFVFNNGNRSKVQQALGIRLDPSAHYGGAANSNGVLIANNDAAGSGYAGTPQTRPVLDKFTLLGPAYCGATGIHGDFRNGVLVYHNAQFGMYNSILSGWPTGFRIEDATTLTNATASPQLIKFEANTLDNHTHNYSHNGTWVTGGCALNMGNWMTQIGSCSQRFNEFSPGNLGYNTSVCEDYCNDNVPSFLMSDDELGDTAYFRVPDLAYDDFFIKSAFRGAFDETLDWTSGWTAFCTDGYDYCVRGKRTGNVTGSDHLSLSQNGELKVYPNPATEMLSVEFNSTRENEIHMSLINSVGQVVRSVRYKNTAGKQHLVISTEGLMSGFYILQVDMAKDEVLRTRVVVK